MKLINRLLDYSKPWTKPHFALFTGNVIIKSNGGLVMGRGAAKQVRDLYPGVDIRMGERIEARGKYARVVWLRLAYSHPEQFLGWFQVKEHWKDQASLELINESAMVLAHTAQAEPHHTFHMNYPGIGNGRLEESQVRVIVERLPDNVWLYRS